MSTKHEEDGKLPVIRVRQDDYFNWNSLPDPHEVDLPEHDHGQIAAYRYPIDGPQGLHRWVLGDGHSYFHLDEADAVESPLDHLLKDTYAGQGGIIGALIGMLGGLPGMAIGGLIGALIGGSVQKTIKVYEFKDLNR